MNTPLPAALHLATASLASAPALLRQLAQASLMGTLFVLAVWLLCRLAPRLPAGLRCALWWLACLKLLLGLAWPAPLALPLLPPAAAALGTSTAAGPSSAGRPSGLVLVTAGPQPAAPASAAAPAAPWWALGLLGLWVAGVLRHAAGMARELRRVRGFLARSAPVRDAAVLRLAADLGSALGLAPVELRAAPGSADLTAPLTAGALRPVVVLPADGLERLSRPELAMTLAHELMHVRRRDLLWGWIPAAAARLFFFLPPAVLAAREYGLAREAACDAAVLRLLGATPASYGRLLLRLGVRSPIGRPRSRGLADLAMTAGSSASAATVGGAAASLQQLKRRLEMLQHHQPAVPPRPARLRRAGLSLLALLAAAALVPLRIVTAVATTTPAGAEAAERSADRPESRHGDSYVFLHGKSDVTMSGDTASIERARKLQQEAGGGDLLWVRHGGKEYVIRDAATLHEVNEIFRPQRELGAKQGELGAQQGELGARQGELGSRQGDLGAQQGKLGAEQGRLAAEQAKLAAEDADDDKGGAGAREARRDELAQRQQKLAAEMRRLGEQQRDLGRQQREMGEPQRQLGEQQRHLGERQRELGRQQRAAAREASAKLHALLDRAVAGGIAQEVK